MSHPPLPSSSDRHFAAHHQSSGVLSDLGQDASSGLPAMDRLHHDLFSALDELSSCDDQNFCPQYMRFVETMERAFREEETWMDEMDFPTLATHQEQHARVLGALHHAQNQIMNGELDLGRHIVGNLLPQWLAFHISTMDTPFALAMQQSQSEKAPESQPS